MRVFSKDLNKALVWLAKGKHNKVIEFLEAKVPIYIENPDYYFILGRTYLEVGLLKDSETYLIRGLQVDNQNIGIKLCLAVLHLKARNISASLKYLLEILEDCPHDRRAKYALDSLKYSSKSKDIEESLSKIRIDKILPRIKKVPRIYIFGIIFIFSLSLFSVYFRFDINSLLFSERPLPPLDDSQLLEEEKRLNSQPEAIKILLTNNEVEKIWNKAIGYYRNYQDNLARRELNKIKYSSSDETVRIKSLLLMKNLQESTIQSIDKSFTYTEVQAQPWLYEGCYVLWKGVVDNVIVSEEKEEVRFDFLVGLHEGRVLEGKVPVKVPFLVFIEPLPLEILARVDRDGETFTLTAQTLHFIRS